MQLNEKVVLIIYYNVLFFLFFELEEDNFKKQCLINRIKDGEGMRMNQIRYWCNYQQIHFKTKFKYRKDFSLKANLWNLYSYVRFKIESII